MKQVPEKYERARINEDGTCSGPKCCGQPMEDDGGCPEGCCDYYKCSKCGYFARVEWPA